MSIRPVDLQVTVQRTPDLNNRTMNNEGNRPEVAQQQFSEKLAKEVKHNEQTVLSSNKAEKQQVDRDGKNDQNGGNSKKKKRKARESNDKPKPKGSSMFDISI